MSDDMYQNLGERTETKGELRETKGEFRLIGFNATNNKNKKHIEW